MNITLSKDQPEQQFQFVLCKAKSMLATRALKVQFKHIENQAEKVVFSTPLYLLMTLKSVLPKYYQDRDS